MDEEFPKLEIRGIVSDYFDGIRWLSQLELRRNLVLFLGSNIGNFHRKETLSFLRTLWNSLKHGDLVLIGFEAFEPILTEYSYKYLESDIERLAQETGFTVELNFYDSRKWFVDAVWRVVKHKGGGAAEA